jgi:hypothetical protein
MFFETRRRTIQGRWIANVTTHPLAAHEDSSIDLMPAIDFGHSSGSVESGERAFEETPPMTVAD